MFKVLLAPNICWFCKSANQSTVILAFQLNSRVVFLYFFAFISPTLLFHSLLFISSKQDFFGFSFCTLYYEKKIFNSRLDIFQIYFYMYGQYIFFILLYMGASFRRCDSMGLQLYEKSSSLLLWSNIHGNIPKDSSHWMQSITVHSSLPVSHPWKWNKSPNLVVVP